MGDKPKFELNLITSNHYICQTKHMPIQWSSELEHQIADKKEKWYKSNTFSFREKIFFNNLPSSFIKDLQFNLSNLFYFQNYYTPTKDFDSVNYEHLQLLRHKYISSFIHAEPKSSEKSNNKILLRDQATEVNEPNENSVILKEYYALDKEKLPKDSIVSIASNLLSVISFAGDNEIKQTIILRLLENITIELKNTYRKDILHHAQTIEEYLLLFLEQFDHNMLINVKEVTRALANIILKIEYIALYLNSSILFLRTLMIIRKLNLSYNNFQFIRRKFFKYDMNSLITNNDKITSIHLNLNSKYEHAMSVSDGGYIFTLIKLCSNCNCILYKIKLNTSDLKPAVVLLEKNIPLAYNPLIKLINLTKGELIIVSCDEQSNYEVITIKKDSLIITSTRHHQLPKEILNNNFEISNITTSKSFLFFFSYKTVIKIKNYYLSEPQYEEFHSNQVNRLNVSEAVVKQFLCGAKQSFFIGNEYIYFYYDKKFLVYHIKKGFYKLNSAIQAIYSNTKIDFYYNSNTNQFVITKKEDNKVKVIIQSNQNLAMENWDDCCFDSVGLFKKILKEKYPVRSISKSSDEPDYSIDEAGANAYFKYFFLLLSKHFYYFGNISNTFSIYITIDNNKERALNQLNKKFLLKTFISNTTNTHLFDFLFNHSSIEKSNEIKELTLLLLQTVLRNYFYFSDSNNSTNQMEKYKNIYEWLFDKIDNENSYNVCLAINSNTVYSKISNLFNNKMMDELSNSSHKLSFQKKLIYYSLLEKPQLNTESNELELMNAIADLEIMVIFEEKDINDFVISKFQLLKDNHLKHYLNLILNWDCNCNNKTTLEYRLFNVIIEKFTILIQKLKQMKRNDNVDINLINTSFICQALFLFVNVIITYSLNHSDYTLLSYYTHIINIIIELDQYSNDNKNKPSHNLTNEEIITVESDHPFNLDQSRQFMLALKDNDHVLRQIQFDSFSQMDSESKLSINSLGPYSNKFPSESILLRDSDSGNANININYQPNTIKRKDLKGELVLSNGYIMKIWNYSVNPLDMNTNSYNLLTEIKRLIIYSIGGLLFNQITNIKPNTIETDSNSLKDNEKESQIMKTLFSSKLLENISLIESSNEEAFKLNGQSTMINSILDSIKDTEIKDGVIKAIQSNFILMSNSNNNNETNTIINKIIGNNIDCFIFAIDYIHKQFASAVLWGNIITEKTRPLILLLFSIVLKHEKLVLAYEKFANELYFQRNNKEFTAKMNNSPSFKLFFKIYSEISKIKIWLKEQELKINQIDSNNQLIEDDEQIIDISTLITNLTSKAEFLLESLKDRPRFMNKKSNEPSLISSIKDHKDKEFNQNMQDIIDNLMLYIQSNEIEISKLKDRISLQNKYALDKESALSILNIVLSLSSNQQNIKDLIYWMNRIAKQNISNSIVDFNHDLYGADPIYSQRVQFQLYTYISIIINKLKETNKDSIYESRYDISYYYTLTQAIAWKLRKRDHLFIQDVDLFEIFESRSTLSKILQYNQEPSQIDTTFDYGCTKININSLSQEVFKVFTLYTLIVFGKFNECNANYHTQNQFKANEIFQLDNLAFKRKVSDIDETESLNIITKISNILFSIYDSYVVSMISFAENKISQNKLINEEKLNDFLLLFYKALSFNKKLIQFFISNYPRLLSTFIQIMMYSSEKNKLICLKLIKEFTLEFNEQLMNTSMKQLKNSLKKHNRQFYSFIIMSKENNRIDTHIESSDYFYNLFLFKYAFVLLNNQSYSFLFKTECDIALAWNIIGYIRSLLLSQISNFEFAILDIIKGIMNNDSMNDNDLSTIGLFVLGVDLYPIHIGSKVVFDYFNKRNKDKDINMLINDFDNSNSALQSKQNTKYGIVIGFTDNQNKLFTYDEETFKVSMTMNYYLKQRRYAIVLPEDMINKQNVNTMSLNNLLFVDSNNIELHRENMFNQTSFLLKAIDNKLISAILNQLKTLKPQLCYLSLCLIKNLLTSKPDIGMRKYEILTNECIDYLTQLGLSTLDIQGPLIPLEMLETMQMNSLCLKSKEEIESEESNEQQKGKENQDELKTKKKPPIDNDKPQIILSSSSYYLKINNNLIIESVYSKVFNYEYFPPQEQSTFLPIHEFDCSNAKNKGYDYIMAINSSIISKEVIDIIKQSENEVKAIITNTKLNEDKEMIDLITNTINVPVITIEDKDYLNQFDFIFRQVTNEEFEGLFMRSMQKDYTSLIDIPCHMVDDSGSFDQRNIVLKVLQEDMISNPLINTETISKAPSSSITPEQSIQKLISLISRRITMIYLSKIKQSREKASKETILTIFKLLLFESNIFQFEKEKKLIDYLSSQSKEINSIIKDYLYNISSNETDLCEWDITFIRALLNMPFSNSVNYIDYFVLPSIDSEKKLLDYIIIENNVKVIFSLLPQVMQLSNSFDIKQYRMELFNCFLIKLNIFKIKSNLTFVFIVDILILLLKQIIDTLNIGDVESINCLNDFSIIFFSNEFTALTKEINDLMMNNDGKEMSNSEINLINFIFVYFDLALKALVSFKINLNLSSFLKSKIMNTYLIYSLMVNKNKDIGLFMMFCQRRGLFEYSNDSSHSSICEFSYYSPSFSLPHLIGFKCDDCYSVEVKVIDMDEKIIGIDNACLIYSDKQCSYLQDYIISGQKGKRVMIKNQTNCFFISYPYSKFKNNLYGCGSNDHQSLGCGGEISVNYTLPQRCKGLENAKNIVDFKFGYYHTFVQLADGNLFVCGDDKGSSIKDFNRPTSKFISDSYFQDIAKKEGLVGVWVNNYNASILVTKTNEIYGCGLNHEYCLSSAIEKEKTVSIPFRMPSIKEKIIQVACGFKSSLFVLEDGTAKTVGCNKYYQCGVMNNNIDSIEEYHHIIPPGKITQAVPGEDYFLLIIDEQNCKGRLYSLGGNQHGKSGIGRGFASQLQKCKEVEGYEFKLIYSRNDSSAAITSTGDLYTFGYNKEGNLGIGNRQDQYKPVFNEALSDYICDDVAISHHHMLVVARSKTNGEKKVFSAGTNEFLNLGIETKENNFTLPEEITFFKQKEFSQQPIRVSVSRYQSYILTIETEIHNDACIYPGLNCIICSKEIENIIFFEQKDEKQKVYYCQSCIEKKKEAFIMFTSSTPIKKSIIETIVFTQSSSLSVLKDLYSYDNESQELTKDYEYNCIRCKGKIIKDSMLFISQDNSNFILCSKCYLSKLDNSEYPQIFFVFYSILPHKLHSQLPKINDLSCQLWSIEHTDKPYLSLEITKKYSFSEEFVQLIKNQKLKEMYDLWISFPNIQMIELNKLKEALESEAYDRNDCSLIDSVKLFKAIKELSNTKQYQNLLTLSFDQINLLCELLEFINNGVYDLISIKTNSNASSFIHKAISENIELINSKERLIIFSDKLEKLKVNFEPHEKNVNLSRIKASKFYEKNEIDTGGDNTLFCQLFHQMKSYSTKNYLSKKEIRLFTVVLEGEGATDYGGPYCDVLSAICHELQSNHLDLFIKTPNNKNEVGNLRDKYIPNPSSISVLHMEMYSFIGCLFTHAISSCHLLNLNLHPIVWNQILGLSVDWEMMSSIDYLFYKYINEIDNCAIKSEVEFANENDINFVIQLSNGNEYELIPNASKTRVTLANKDSFVSLAKKACLNEFSIQIDSIKDGVLNIIPESILLLLTPKELEESVCGKAIINIAILKQYTEYQGFTSDHPTIVQFWKAMESFSNDERILYLKYVWGRTRLPDPHTFPFVHIISTMYVPYPDKRLPTAATCYFTLKLPKYSTYEILQEKLRYVITNCSEIDTDFTVRN